MTPADFDRPYVDEAAERFVEQSPPEIRHQSRSEQPEAAGEPAAPAEAPAEEKPAGERKRGWWKRVLS